MHCYHCKTDIEPMCGVVIKKYVFCQPRCMTDRFSFDEIVAIIRSP